MACHPFNRGRHGPLPNKPSSLCSSSAIILTPGGTYSPAASSSACSCVHDLSGLDAESRSWNGCLRSYTETCALDNKLARIAWAVQQTKQK